MLLNILFSPVLRNLDNSIINRKQFERMGGFVKVLAEYKARFAVNYIEDCLQQKASGYPLGVRLHRAVAKVKRDGDKWRPGAERAARHVGTPRSASAACTHGSVARGAACLTSVAAAPYCRSPHCRPPLIPPGRSRPVPPVASPLRARQRAPKRTRTKAIPTTWPNASSPSCPSRSAATFLLSEGPVKVTEHQIKVGGTWLKVVP